MSVWRELGSAHVENECSVSIRRGLGFNHTLCVQAMATVNIPRWTFEKVLLCYSSNRRKRGTE